MRKFTRHDILRAYDTLELPVGTSFGDAMARYRKLAPGLHPDRFHDRDQKKSAEEELKRLNHAKDVLKDHFKGPNASHVPGADCACSQAYQSKEAQETQRKKAEETERANAEAKRKEAEEKAAAAAAEEAAKKAFEEALEKAAAEAERQKAVKAAQEALKQAAQEALWKADQARRAASMAAAAVQGDLAYTLHKQSTVDRWWCARVCAFVFVGILCITTLGASLKGAASKAPIVNAGNGQQLPEVKAQEDRFYAKEKERLSCDAAHAYDAQVDDLLNQIKTQKTQLESAQADINRLRQEPNTEANAGAIEKLQNDMYTDSLFWQSASDRLDALVRQHPEIDSGRIAQRPRAPVMTKAGNQHISQETETRRGLI